MSADDTEAKPDEPGPFLTGERVTLHPPEESDLPFARDLVNHPAVRPGISSSTPQTLADEREWLGRHGDGEYFFVLRANGDRVGVLGLHEHDQPWGQAELGYFVHPEHWNQGYATDAVRTVVAYAFDERRHHKLEARAFATNEGSRRVLEKAGFETEGRRRDHAYVEGEYVDLLDYGLLASEWAGED